MVQVTPSITLSNATSPNNLLLNSYFENFTVRLHVLYVFNMHVNFYIYIYIYMGIKLACMLKTCRTCNLMLRFLKYEFNNRLLGDVTLLRVIPSVT